MSNAREAFERIAAELQADAERQYAKGPDWSYVGDKLGDAADEIRAALAEMESDWESVDDVVFPVASMRYRRADGRTELRVVYDSDSIVFGPADILPTSEMESRADLHGGARR